LNINKPIAVVLGGTYPHIKLLRNLAERGYHTILIDYYEAPCAKPYAGLHIQESTLDRERVLQIAKMQNASLVISSCIDQANLIACSVAEELGLPHPYNSQTGSVVTNKLLMKEFMSKHGIPSSRFVKITDIHEINVSALRYPLIAKPSDSNSSKGVEKIDSADQLIESAKNAIALSRSKEAVIEEFVEGREIGLDFYVNCGKPQLLITKERRKIPRKADPAQQIYGCFWPANLTASQVDECIEIANTIASSLGIDNSPLMIQAIIGKEGIRVIEFAARFGGGESFKIIELASGVDIIDLSIRSFLHEQASVVSKASDLIYAETFIYAEECEFHRILVNNALVNEGIVDCVHQYKSAGMSIGEKLTSNNRVGCFIVSGSDLNEVKSKIKIALNGMQVFDVKGCDRMRRDVYRFEEESQ